MKIFTGKHKILLESMLCEIPMLWKIIRELSEKVEKLEGKLKGNSADGESPSRLKCAFCNKPEYMPKWFICPDSIYRPNQYSVCEDHKNLSLTFNDVYPEPDGHAVTRHEEKVNHE